MQDDDLRSSCFAALDVLCAKHGMEVPYVGGLDAGFAFRGRRVPFLNYQKGIYRAAAQRGPAALSVNTSYKSPYSDEETPDGFVYAYRAGAIDQPDNRALRAAHSLRAPIVYFVGTRPGWYRPEWPVFVAEDRPEQRAVLLTTGRMVGPYDCAVSRRRVARVNGRCPTEVGHRGTTMRSGARLGARPVRPESGIRATASGRGAAGRASRAADSPGRTWRVGRSSPRTRRVVSASARSRPARSAG